MECVVNKFMSAVEKFTCYVIDKTISGLEQHCEDNISNEVCHVIDLLNKAKQSIKQKDLESLKKTIEYVDEAVNLLSKIAEQS